MMNFMQALIFSASQFYKLFRNYPFLSVLPTEHHPPHLHATDHS